MIQLLANKLAECPDIKKKIELLSSFPPVLSFLEKNPLMKEFIIAASPEEELILKAILAAGQGDRLLTPFSKKKVLPFLYQLIPVEKFYSPIGGIVGYQARTNDILQQIKKEKQRPLFVCHPFKGIDIREENREIRRAIINGIKALPFLAEIYPLGGAADRLKLHDEKSGFPLPAACLPFLGKTLLQGLIEDLQAREYLYYKLFGEQLTTPIAMMTSEEKDNHTHIVTMGEKCGWFGRPIDSFRLFLQPRVPVINRKGEWCLRGPLEILMKPGGHGVMWQLAREEGIFDWFFLQGREKVIVRQVNNPVANTDYGIIAFTGIGYAEKKWFGFASCPRQVKASEGVNVLIETATEQGFNYQLTSVEYCDFKKFGILDEPENGKSSYSKFPSNTNILFADLKAVLKALDRCAFPGTLVNLKNFTYHLKNGQKKQEKVARLESTMQNIADFFEEHSEKCLETHEQAELKTYLTYNHRRKTISATKREFICGSSLLETPEGCFLDLLENNRDLLVLYSCFTVPAVTTPLDFIEKGPSFIFLYHPSLGPLYSIIAQKIRMGKLHYHSELQLHLSELCIENLDLHGSLLIFAESVMGHLDKDQHLIYSERCGRAILKNVVVRNSGIDYGKKNFYWRNEIHRKEMCQILLHGNSEFYAENITLQGNLFIEVPDGHRCRAVEINQKIEFIFEPIAAPSWWWNYVIDEEDRIVLSITS